MIFLDPSKKRDAKSEAEYEAVWLGLASKSERRLDLLQVTCVAVYLLLMSFAQKGIDELRRHQEEMLEDHPDADYIVSEGFDDGELLFVPSLDASILTSHKHCAGFAIAS